MLPRHIGRPRPGDRLIQTIWLMALSLGGDLPLPTVERINKLKRLVASWPDEAPDNE